jgi:hypothetical protein
MKKKKMGFYRFLAELAKDVKMSQAKNHKMIGQDILFFFRQGRISLGMNNVQHFVPTESVLVKGNAISYRKSKCLQIK